jgi:hypothetical protein
MRPLVVALALIVGGAGVASAGTPAMRPSLKLVATHPVTLHGKGFGAFERLRLTVHARATRIKRIRATASGTFAVTFDGFRYDRCTSGLLITATGTTHSARLKLPPTECPVP